MNLDIEKKFFKACQENNYSKKDNQLFKKAIDFSKKEFKDKKLLSGEFYYEHSIKIGIILVENKLFTEVIVAGLLYGLEKIKPLNEIQEEFGKDIASLVYGQINLEVLRKKNPYIEAEILRKIILTSLSDIRIIFVKLANKLENLKTLEVFPEKERKRISTEVMEIYAPLAGRLGLYNIRKELEDNAFYYLNKKKYNEIKNFIEAYHPERENFIKNCIENVSLFLKNKTFFYSIKGREKHIYSIYKKIKERKVPLDKQRDHFAIRIITDTEKNCYNILGLIYEKYEPFLDTFKDYIANPKPNGYKSLHTIIKVEEKYVEVQIRTREMDEIAEEGLAAHWSYKGIKSDQDFEKKVGFLKSVLDLQLTQKEDEFLKNIKVDLFADEIYCYTPKGKLITLPKNSCVLDFAYYIHQEIGNKTVAGRINGRFESLKKELFNGDIVEIITNKNQRPHRAWLNFVVSSRARNSIRKSIKKYEKIPVSQKITYEKKDKDFYDPLVYSEDFLDKEFIFAKCCSCIPGEEICGKIKSNKKILVHNFNCGNIDNSKKEVIPLYWKQIPEGIIKLNIESQERSGILAELLNIFVSKGFVIKEAKVKLPEDSKLQSIIKIFPKATSDLINVLNQVKKIKGFKRAYIGE